MKFLGKFSKNDTLNKIGGFSKRLIVRCLKHRRKKYGKACNNMRDYTKLECLTNEDS